MIYSLHGTLTAREPSLAVIECGGVGYACRITYVTGASLGELGSEVFLYTYLYLREDAVELFGFAERQELDCFKLLLGVSGVGPKAALSILSDLTPERFVLTIAAGDSKVFTKTKGVGPKLAQRIVLELKDRITKEHFASGADITASPVGMTEGSAAEAVSALMVLGYEQSEVMPILATLAPGLSASELIKQTLKVIGSKKQ